MRYWNNGKYRDHERLLTLADEGDPKALCNIGYGYYDGDLGFPRDLDKAVEYWTRAADLGDVCACLNLGECDGVQTDQQKAKALYLKAAGAGPEALVQRDKLKKDLLNLVPVLTDYYEYIMRSDRYRRVIVPDITLEFSDELVYRKYKGRSTKTIQSDFRSVEKAFDRYLHGGWGEGDSMYRNPSDISQVKKLLDKLKDLRDRFESGGVSDGNLDELERYMERHMEEVDPELVRAVKDLITSIRSRSFRSLLLGVYSVEQNKVTLYIKAIEESRGNRRLEDALRETFAHEVFHAWHSYMLIDRSKWPVGSKASDQIVEGLASYVEYYYCKECLNDAAAANKLEASWYAHSVSVWPYSAAAYLKDTYVGPEEHKLARTIFRSSLSCFKKAGTRFNVCRGVSDDLFDDRRAHIMD